MQREDVERLERWSYVEDEDLDHHGFQPQDNGGWVRYVDVMALLDRAEKAEAEVVRLAASDMMALFNAAAGATTAIAHALDDGDVRDSSSGQLEASLNALNDALARPSAPDTLAWAVVDEDDKLDPYTIFGSKERAEAFMPPGCSLVRVAIRVVESVE